VSGSASIVGAGIFGASLAHRLARDGWKVTLYERHEPGHPGAASGGESRLLRSAHGSDGWYTRSAWRARDLWRELEVETGQELLVESGIAWFARSDSGWEAESERVLRAEGIPVERLEPDTARELFPSFEPGDLQFVLWEPSAGVLRARAATLATVEAAERAGVQLVQEVVRPGAPQADVVVWAAGAWLQELLGLPIRVTKQDTLYVAGEGWATPPVPAWVDYDRAIYGHGDLDGLGVKVAPDAEGPPFDPEHGERTVSAGTEQTARAYLAERFPALRDAPLIHAVVCQYALTADTNFVLARRPGTEREWILGGGSGHGFKHGPALAEYAARVVTGQEEPGEQFGLGPRERRPSLRTAGTT
jgi:glycine/D-amino acid oxidase-like deaminating enzyme